MGAAVLLCAADWIEQEAQDAAGSLGGQLSGASFTPLSFCGRLQVGCGWSCIRGCIDRPPLSAAP
jgi:hypothetical protein